MNTRFRATKDYIREFDKYISVKKGDKIEIIKRNDGKYKEWFWCKSFNGVETYVPESVLEIDGNVGTFLSDYNSLELTVKKGDIVTGILETGGWVWCRNSSNDLG